MARDVPAGRAFIEFFLKGDQLSRDMRNLRRRLTRMTAIVTGVAAAFTAVGAAAGTVAVAGIIKATNAAGDFAETVSKFETVFGDRAASVRQWADDAAEALGITRREALATLSSFQDLFVPLGIDAGTAEEMSKQLTQLAVDLASFNNLRSEDVVRDLQAAMTGSSETMKKYGAIVDAAAVKQELLNQGLDPTTATNAEKAMARLALIMGSTTAAQGDAIRTADSYNNSLRRMSTAFEELLTETGERFLPLMQDLGRLGVAGVNQLRDALKEVLPTIQDIDEAVIGLAQSGNWEAAGRIIGLQLLQGIRNAIGPGLFDFLNTAVQVSGLQGGINIAREAARQANQIPGAVNFALAANQLPQISAGLSTEERTAAIQSAIEQQLEIARKQLEAQEATREAVEDQEGLRLQ